MSEAYPVFRGEKLGFVASTSEFTILGLPGVGRKVYLWRGGRGYEIDWRSYDIDDMKLELNVWATYAPLEAWRRIDDVDEYVDMLARLVSDRIRGRKLLLSFSGGKDSTAALVILDKLYERVDFKLKVVHVHMPFLEPSYHIDEAVRIASKLGYDVEVIQPPPKVLARRLMQEGLPWRRARWCTYYKTRPLEELFERIDADYMVVGDRVGESLTRAKRLKQDDFFDRERFEPIKFLTLIDVVLIARRYGLVHVDYRRGLLRVSCRYCPYRGIAELLVDGRYGEEDPGFIDEVLKREWRKWYSDYVDYEVFVREHLWRYVPRVARLFARAKERLTRGEPRIDPGTVKTLHSSVWFADEKLLTRLPLVGVGPAEEAPHQVGKGRPSSTPSHTQT